MLVGLRREYGRFITSGAQLLLALIGARIGTPLAWSVCAALIAAISLAAWASTYRRARAIDDTPTSKVASAAQGYVELSGRGRALAGLPVVSPVSRLTCLWYRYIAERQDSERKWRRDSAGESDASFILDDGSGQCLVDTEGAEILAANKEIWVREDYRYTEWRLLPNDPIYVLGEFFTRGSADLQLDREEDVKALLAEWKKDPRALLKRFDVDGNGELDLEEWERARTQARREVERMHGEQRLQAELHTLRRPADGRLYLISSLSAEKLGRRYRWWSIAHLVIFFAALAGLAMALKSTA
jgi:hypothetical protein